MSTKQRAGIGRDTAATVAHGEDVSAKPRAIGVSSNGELYIATSGSVSSSLDVHIYGSASDGYHPIACKLAEDGSGDYALKTDTELVLSGNVVVSNVRTLSTDGTSGSLVYGKASSEGVQYVRDIMSIFKYQLGVDFGSYTNATTGTLVNLYGVDFLTASSICPIVYNATDNTYHTVDLTSVTTSSITVSPAITTASASLLIRLNVPELDYNAAAQAEQVLVTNPSYEHYTGPTTWISESNGAQGLVTSSDIPVTPYSKWTIQFSRMTAVSCELSATLSTDASPYSGDFFPVTDRFYPGATISSDSLLVNSSSFRAARLRLNYWKTNATNGILVKYILND